MKGILLLVPVFAISIVMFFIGFHNVDLAANAMGWYMMKRGIFYDFLTLVDCNLSHCATYPELYMRGLFLMVLGYFILFFVIIAFFVLAKDS